MGREGESRWRRGSSEQACGAAGLTAASPQGQGQGTAAERTDPSRLRPPVLLSQENTQIRDLQQENRGEAARAGERDRLAGPRGAGEGVREAVVVGSRRRRRQSALEEPAGWELVGGALGVKGDVRRDPVAVSEQGAREQRAWCAGREGSCRGHWEVPLFCLLSEVWKPLPMSGCERGAGRRLRWRREGWDSTNQANESAVSAVNSGLYFVAET